MDMISRQAVLDMLEDINNHINDGCKYRHDWCVEWVKGLPSVDAVPVIRCKDCKYYKENTLVCSRYGLEDDDYCSWAERRE